ncbi:hypothetical protein TRAPUB_9657 [Trametes pubescens]|uniref:Uncharacterized protein n=1 Tax=Trametes pubescens TaxID=154538 RepID=A0A1M2W211_TRAPU|nr:hypothetical protein TRAPUB_9657 [Trametes pubescens]
MESIAAQAPLTPKVTAGVLAQLDPGPFRRHKHEGLPSRNYLVRSDITTASKLLRGQHWSAVLSPLLPSMPFGGMRTSSVISWA